MKRVQHRRVPVTVITEAEPSQQEQLRTRERRYLIMMGTRAVCLVGAALTFRVWWPLGALFIVGMVVLPWCAVLIANDRPPLRPSVFHRLVHPNPERAIEGERSDRVIDP